MTSPFIRCARAMQKQSASLWRNPTRIYFESSNGLPELGIHILLYL